MFRFSRNRNKKATMDASGKGEADTNEEMTHGYPSRDDSWEPVTQQASGTGEDGGGEFTSSSGGGFSSNEYTADMESAYADEEESHIPPKGLANEKKRVQFDNGKDGDEIEGNDATEEAAKNENDEQWKKFLGTVELEEVPNLSPYLSAKEAREAARENFLKALEECEGGLRKSMLEEMLKDTIVAIHQEQGERFENHETDIISTMVSNHERRKEMLKSIDTADAEWREKYKRVRRNIEQEEVSEFKQGHEDEERHDMMEQKEKLNEEQKMESDDRNNKEPNWDELAEHEPSRPNIQRFLDARSNFQQANMSLEHFMDEVYAGLELEVQNIIDKVGEVYRDQEEVCTEMERNIEHYIMNNHRRREDCQKQIEESEKKMSGLYASLLSRLGIKR